MKTMSKLIRSLLTAIFLLTVFSLQVLGQSIHQAIRDELLEMEKADQQARTKCTDGETSKQLDCFIEISRNIDEPNAKRLKAIFEQIGFPDTKKVGSDGLRAFMILLQHMQGDELREKCVKPITRAFKQKELTPMAYANFIDRFRLHQGRKQRFGSNFDIKDGKLVMSPTEDLKNLKKRRAEIGLPSLDEYVKELAALYKMEVIVPES